MGCVLRAAALALLVALTLGAPTAAAAGSSGKAPAPRALTLAGGPHLELLLGDTVSALEGGPFLGARLSGGLISALLFAEPGESARGIRFEERVIGVPAPAGTALYEFGGHYLKVYAGSLTMHVAALQGRGALVRSLCSTQPPAPALEVSLHGASGLTLYSADWGGVAVLIDAGGPQVALVPAENAELVAVEAPEGPGGVARVTLKARGPCLTMVVAVRGSRVGAIEAASTSPADYLGAAEVSGDLYGLYASAAPSVRASVRDVEDSYYLALYGRLNAALHPEAYGLAGLNRTAFLWATYRVALLSGEPLRGALLRGLLGALEPGESPLEAWLYLEVSRAIGLGAQEVCGALRQWPPVLSPPDAVAVAALAEECNASASAQAAAPPTAVDLAALSELGLAGPPAGAWWQGGPPPPGPWGCLAVAGALRARTLPLHELVAALRGHEAPCADYIILLGVAGLMVEGGELLVAPSIPFGLSLSVDAYPGGRPTAIEYKGWGRYVGALEVGGKRLEAPSVPLSLLGGTLRVELVAPPPVEVEVVVLQGGQPLAGAPLYARVSGYGISYTVIAFTDGAGRARITAVPGGVLLVTVNVTGVGLVQLSTVVAEGGTVVVDVAKAPTGAPEWGRSDLQNRLLEVEAKLEEALRGPALHRALTMASLALSSVALALALARLVGEGK